MDVKKFSFDYINNLVLNLSEDTRFGYVMKMRFDEINGFKDCEYMKDKPKKRPQDERYKKYVQAAKNCRTKYRLKKLKVRG